MPTYVAIAVNVPRVSGVYHYHLPDALEGILKIGHLVEVPFGRRRVQGVVVDFVSQPEVTETKPVTALVESQAVLTEAQISLAQHMAHTNLTPWAYWIDLMLPAGLAQRADTLFSLGSRYPLPQGQRITPLQKRILGLIAQRGDLTGRQITRAMSRVNWRASIQGLVRKQILNSKPVLSAPGVQPKMVRTVQLIGTPNQIEASSDLLGRRSSQAYQRRKFILQYLKDNPGEMEVAIVLNASGGNTADLIKLSGLGLIKLGERQTWRDPLEEVGNEFYEVPKLTSAQQTCLSEVLNALEGVHNGKKVRPILLHGVTGSGKTEIYLQAVQAVLNQGKQAIIMVPEIAMTPQTINRFVGRFGERVGLLHSRLSIGERYDTWRRAQSGELDVIVGPRSALFAPLARIGLIVLDECHDASYYQAEPPFYHARQVAVEYAGLIGSICLMGSATPDIESAYQAEQGKWQYLSLPDRILAHRKTVQAQVASLHGNSHYRPFEEQADTMELPPVSVVDMRLELKGGNRSIFSRLLQDALDDILSQGQQAILFLNRRGMATYVFCRDCGLVIKCPQCDLPLTSHNPPQFSKQRAGGTGSLECHHCGYRRNIPNKCPQCGSQRIRQLGTGTERVEAEVQAHFPRARTIRWDYETTRQKGSHTEILNAFAAHKADILIGTQMLAKGLDLPLVTLVGVVLADVGLNLPDYTAAERTFQVLTQVAGRAGRSPLGGQVILQTFDPEHYVIKAAAAHNFRAFYQQELQYRKQLGYPPYKRLVRLEYRSLNKTQAETIAQKMAAQIKTWLDEEGKRNTEMIGPAPCFFEREGGYYRWQIVLRGADPLSVLAGRRINDWRVEQDPISLL
ncbi:MAG: primosomal protein N' [Anaerolineales bacterium]|nr:primosomal protein N' [Anaerolineales bacterium]